MLTNVVREKKIRVAMLSFRSLMTGRAVGISRLSLGGSDC